MPNITQQEIAGQEWWFIPVISATQQVEIRKIAV
jgi:hypothetical protein